MVQIMNGPFNFPVPNFFQIAIQYERPKLKQSESTYILLHFNL